MKIVVVNTAASDGGALSILKDFYQYIKDNDSLNEWIFILSDYYLEETDNISVKVIKESKSKINRLKLDNFNGHHIIGQYNPDIVFSMQNTTISNLSVPQVLYLHQSIPFQKIKNYSFLKKEEFKYASIQYLLGANIKYGLKRADKIIVQTNWMKKAIIDQTNIESKNIIVVAPSIDLKTNSLNKTDEFKSNSFFYPSSSFPYKNNYLVEKACNYIDSIEPNLDYRVEITVDEKFENKHIHSIGKITRQEVYNKLNNGVLIFPSYIETFGLPLAEGRVMNSLILAADTSFSKEILQNYHNSYFFNPFNEEELAQLMIDSIKGHITKKNSTKTNMVYNNSWERVHDLLINTDLSF